jgi:hypothetical protein
VCVSFVLFGNDGVQLHGGAQMEDGEKEGKRRVGKCGLTMGIQ